MNTENRTIRVGLQTEEFDDCNRTACGLFSPQEAESLKDLLPRFGLPVTWEALDPQRLFDVEVANDKGGVMEDLRTRDEVEELLLKFCRLQKRQAQELLVAAESRQGLATEAPNKQGSLTILRTTNIVKS